MGKYRSIADCEICVAIPQKSHEDLQSKGKETLPPELSRLDALLIVQDPAHRYASRSITLLKCSFCGTYYHHEHHDDDGEFFMDTTSDDIYVDRYGPYDAIKFLEGVPRRPPEEAGPKARESAQKELLLAREQYPEVISHMRSILHKDAGNWHIRRHALEVLCIQDLLENNHSGLEELWEKNSNPVTRAEAAIYLLGLGSVDKARTYSLSQSNEVKKAAAPYILNHIDRIVKMLLEVTESAKVQVTCEYDWLMGWSEKPLRHWAIFGLLICASEGANMRSTIPGLVALLSENRVLNDRICWLLRRCVEKDPDIQQNICNTIKKLIPDPNSAIRFHPYIRTILKPSLPEA